MRYPATLRNDARIAIVQGLFFVSGFCGLIYESIWTHYLKLFLGHAAYAQSVVLVVFIGGMAIGAAVAGRYAGRIRRPLIAYAIAEFVVGWIGLAFHVVFVASTDWAYATLIPATCRPEAWCVSSWALAALLILPQSILLGTTFPLMTSGLLRLVPRDPGRRIALLYFLNSIGAVFGVLASAFVFIPAVGLPGATMAAGFLNVLLALAIYVIARLDGGAAPAPVENLSADAGPRDSTARILFGVAALTGLSSFGYEIAWIRMLSQVLGASTHAFELMLASFILGLALGGAWIRRRIDRIRAPIAFLAIVQLAMGLCALASIVLYDRAFDAMAWLVGALAKSDGGYLLFNAGSAVIAMAIMLPATFAAGMTLPLLTFVLLGGRYGERAIGYVYAWNTLGAIAGVLLAVHLGLPEWGVQGTLIAAAGIDIALGCFLLAAPPRQRTRFAAAVLALFAVAATASAPWWATIDPRKTLAGVYRTGIARLAGDPTILYRRDGKTASVSVTRTTDDIVTIRTNGKPDASAVISDPPGDWIMSDEPTMVLAAAFALARNPAARDIAVIGFGSGMTTAAFLDDPDVRSVDTIEIEPAMVEGARHFMPKVAEAYGDARSRIVIDDAKSYFAKSDRKYDVIVSEPSNPWVAGVASLFTEEFYRQAERRLNRGGVLAQWVQGYEFDQQLLGSIVKAALTVFPDATLYNTSGTDLILIATRGDGGAADASRLFAHPTMSARLASVGIASPADLERRRIIGPRRIRLLFSGTALPANSDYFPVVDIGAAAARFKGSWATDAIELLSSPLPVVDLIEGRGPPEALPPMPPPEIGGLAQRWTDARVAYEFFTSPAFERGDPPPQVDAARDLATARMVLVDCVSPAGAIVAWDSVITLASEFGAVLPSAQMDAFVDVIERSRCRRQAPEATAAWLRLFRAVGHRDAARTADAASSLLMRGDLTIQQHEYATIAALAGLVGTGQMEPARQVLARNHRLVRQATRETPWYRLLQSAIGE
jgi:predicted membrane-bound spermidine synthase